jgi:hypothetical protein
MKQIGGLVARLNRKDELGQLTKLRITQGCQRASLIKDIWKVQKLPEDRSCWKNNLACLTIVKARELGININTETELWTTNGYGLKVIDIVEPQLWKKSGSKISEAGLIYLNQLLDTKGERLITWQQFKTYQNQSSKGKKAEWFKAIETKVLNRTESREVKEQFKTDRCNTQAMKIKWGTLSKDRRKKEWIIHSATENRQMGKIVKKKKKKLLIEHWQMHNIETNLITKIDKCKGCSRDEKIEENSCQYWIRINNNINTVPDMLIGKNNNIIKAATNQLIEYTRTKELIKNEQKLIGLKTLEGLEIELIRKQKIRENISQELVEVLRRNILKDKNKYTIYTDGAANKRNKEEAINKNMSIGWMQIAKAQNWLKEKVALGVKGWPTFTTAEVLAI